MAWTANDLAVVAITSTVCLGALTSIVCWNLRRSRCTDLSLCGVSCARTLMTKSELSTDTRQTMDMLSMLYNNRNGAAVDTTNNTNSPTNAVAAATYDVETPTPAPAPPRLVDDTTAAPAAGSVVVNSAVKSALSAALEGMLMKNMTAAT